LIRIRLHPDPDPVKIRIWPDPTVMDPVGSGSGRILKYGIRCIPSGCTGPVKYSLVSALSAAVYSFRLTSQTLQFNTHSGHSQATLSKFSPTLCSD